MSYLALTDEELSRLLNEDVQYGDLTTKTSGISQQAGRLEFRARQEMVVCAVEEAARLFTLNGATIKQGVNSGQLVSKEFLLMEVQGTAQILHRVWKTAQVLIEWASGISTCSAAIVHAASPVTVACTRKNVPGTKALSVKAVRAGGATMHRLGLSESLLLFPEHLVYLHEAPAEIVARVRRAEPEKKFVVEVANITDAILWAKAGAEVLQLEKFTPESVAECRNTLNREGMQTLLAAAGGIRVDNASAYVRAGADFLVTSAPYTAPPKDVEVTFFK